MENFDSDELYLVCESQNVLENLSEMKRILLAASKSNKIKGSHIKDVAASFNELSEMAYILNKSSAYHFFKKYNFFKPGIQTQFLN